jgi:hypothetical protein
MPYAIVSSSLEGPPPLKGRRPSGTRIWIITEADRLVTTILLPEEY